MDGNIFTGLQFISSLIIFTSIFSKTFSNSAVTQNESVIRSNHPDSINSYKLTTYWSAGIDVQKINRKFIRSIEQRNNEWRTITEIRSKNDTITNNHLHLMTISDKQGKKHLVIRK